MYPINNKMILIVMVTLVISGLCSTETVVDRSEYHKKMAIIGYKVPPLEQFHDVLRPWFENAYTKKCIIHRQFIEYCYQNGILRSKDTNDCINIRSFEDEFNPCLLKFAELSCGNAMANSLANFLSEKIIVYPPLETVVDNRDQSLKLTVAILFLILCGFCVLFIVWAIIKLIKYCCCRKKRKRFKGETVTFQEDEEEATQLGSTETNYISHEDSINMYPFSSHDNNYENYDP